MERVGAPAALDRNTLYFWLFLIAAANALVGPAARSVEEHGWLYAGLDLFGISAILWLALVAGLVLLRRNLRPPPLGRGDVAIGAMVVGAAALPAATASSLSLALVALYAILTSERGSVLRRAAIVFLAVTGTLIWGRLLLALFSGPMLGADAWLVAHLVGTTQNGNELAFADGSGTFAVAPGCSSFQGMSLALLFWATITQWFAVPLGWRQALWCLAALAVTIAVNVVRIGALAHFPHHFDALHTGVGYHLAAWTTLLLVVAVCLYGARREIFARI